MKVEMVMPQMGESIAEGTIVKWKKGVGDLVELDEDILEISTDKVDSEIPSPATGRIVEILVPEGETVPIKTTLAIIQTDGETAADEGKPVSREIENETPHRPPAQESSPHDGSDAGGLVVREFRRKDRIEKRESASEPITTDEKSTFISPLVQNIAASEGIPLDEVQRIPGTGRSGRVTKKDILAYIEGRKVAPPTPRIKAPEVTEEAKVVRPAAHVAEAPAASPPPAIWRGAYDEIIEMDRMRRSIADHMLRSVHTSPHVVSYAEVNVDRIVKHRESFKKGFREREGINITYTSYFIHLAAKALKEFPFLNASVDRYTIILRKPINIGFAVELPGSGLIVPVIKGVDALSLTGVARGLHELAEKARAGKLDPEDVSGGTFTVTNVGVFGNIAGAPIINQPQVAILGTGAIRKMPVVIDTPNGDAIAIRWMMMISLSYDHRLIDGAMAGRFMARYKQLLENYEE